MKTVFVADSPAQAHLVAGLLDEAGIRNVVEGEMLFGVRGEIGLTPSSLPKVNVTDEDFDRARAAIVASRHAGDERPDEPPAPEPTGLRWFKRFLRLWVFVKVAAVVLLLALLAAWLFSQRS